MIHQTHFHSFPCNNFESSMLRASIASSSFNIHRHRQDTADEALDRNQSKSCSYLVVSHHMCIASLIWQNDPWRNILCKTKHFTQTILFLWISTSHIFCSSATASCYSCAVYHGFNLMSVLKNREMTTCSASGSSEEKTRQQFYFLHLSNECCWMCTIRMRHLITIVRNKLLLVSVMFSSIKIKLLI